MNRLTAHAVCDRCGTTQIVQFIDHASMEGREPLPQGWISVRESDGTLEGRAVHENYCPMCTARFRDLFRLAMPQNVREAEAVEAGQR